MISHVRAVMAITLIGMAFRVHTGRTAGFMNIFIPGLVIGGFGKVGIPDLRCHGLGGYRDIFGPYNGYGRYPYDYQILPPDQVFLEFNGQKNDGYDWDDEAEIN
jgi:hypothetical protein